MLIWDRRRECIVDRVDSGQQLRHYDLVQAVGWKPRFVCCVGIGISVFFHLCLRDNAAAANTDPVALPAPVAHQVDFAKQVHPLLSNSCYECHGPQKQKGGLRLDQKAAAFNGGDSGPALLPGKSAESLLIQAVAGIKSDLARMPKKRDPLTPEQIGLLRAWIDQRAPWPESAIAGNSRDWHKHWAFKPPVRSTLPAVNNTRWVRNPIDSFILSRLEREHLTPSAEANKITLLRRLSLDLIGLPPTITEVDAF